MKRLDYKDPEYNRIKDEVSKRFDGDFNFLQLDIIKKVFDNCEYEYIEQPDIKILIKEYLDNYNEAEIKAEYLKDEDIKLKDFNEADFYDWIKEVKETEISDNYDDRQNYPMWNTLFEARDNLMSDWIENHIDELYNIGIGVLRGNDHFNNMLFISGAGYDFYQAHWIPLYLDLLKWVSIKKETA